MFPYEECSDCNYLDRELLFEECRIDSDGETYWHREYEDVCTWNFQWFEDENGEFCDCEYENNLLGVLK